LSGRGLCDELITRPEESYRLWCIVVCELETSRMGAPYIYDISTLRVNHLWLSYASTQFTGTYLVSCKDETAKYLLQPSNSFNHVNYKNYVTCEEKHIEVIKICKHL